MYKSLAADLDELVVYQAVTPARSLPISKVPLALEAELRYSEFAPRRVPLQPRVRGFKYELGRLDVHVHPASHGVWHAEAFVDSASWHQERDLALLDVYVALEAVHYAFGGQYVFPIGMRPTYVRSIAVHVDYTPFRCGRATRNRFLTRQKLEWNDPDEPHAGLHAGEFFRWYDKLAEIEEHPEKDHMLSTWVCNGATEEDLASGIGRLEFTWNSRRRGTLESLDPTALFRKGLDRVRLMRKPRGRGGDHPRGWNEDPLWTFLRSVKIPDVLAGQFLSRPRVGLSSTAKLRRDRGIASRAMGRILAHTEWEGSNDVGELELLFADMIQGDPTAAEQAFDAARRERLSPFCSVGRPRVAARPG